MRIVDLVARLAAQVARPTSTIRFTGLRPGEKLNEALFSENEERTPTDHERIWKTVRGR